MRIFLKPQKLSVPENHHKGEISAKSLICRCNFRVFVFFLFVYCRNEYIFDYVKLLVSQLAGVPMNWRGMAE